MPQQMRILYHHRTQGRGGEGNHIVSIVTALRSLGHTVDVLSPPGVDPFSAASTIPVDKSNTSTKGWASAWKFMSLHLPNWVFELGEIAYNVPAYFRLRTALRRGYDLVFERYAFFMVAGAVAAGSAKCRFLFEANEVCGIPNRARKQSFPALCRAFERFMIRRSTAGHAVSSYLGRLLIAAGLAADRLAVVPNGFEVSRLKLTSSRDAMRERLGLTGSCVIGFSGWFDTWDRLDFLLAVFERLRSGRPDLRLCLVGDGPALQGLRERLPASRFSNDVVITGAVPRAEVYNYMQTFDIGVLPHSNDFGSPMVMFEMMGLRIPLAVPRVPPIEDVHIHGDTAEIFSPLDMDACMAAVQRLIDDQSLRQQRATRAYEKLTTQHTWRDTAMRILSVLESASAAKMP